MDTSKHDFSGLFAQLGLAADPASIRAFLSTHSLPAGMALAAAPFWNVGQSDFLSQALDDDGDWAELIDALATQLSK